MPDPAVSHPLRFSLELRARQAARSILAGGVIAYPTEAVYGLGCLPEARAAVLRLLGIKHRPVSKGLLLIGAELVQLERYALLDASPFAEEILAGWPGPLTWVLPARRRTPAWITGGRRSVAVRLTAHPLARSLCLHCGSAIVSTSANRSNHPPLKSALGVRRTLGRALDEVLAGPLGGRSAPSVIRDGMTGRVLRA